MLNKKKSLLCYVLISFVIFQPFTYADSSYPIPKDERQSDIDGRLDIKGIFNKSKGCKKQALIKNEDKTVIWNLALNILSKHTIEILDYDNGLIVTNPYKDCGCEYKSYIIISNNNTISCNVLKRNGDIFVRDAKKSAALENKLNSGIKNTK